MATFKKQRYFQFALKLFSHPTDDYMLDTRNMVVSKVKTPFLEYTLYFGKQNSLNEKSEILTRICGKY